MQEDRAEGAAAGGELSSPHSPGLHAPHRSPLHVDQGGAAQQSSWVDMQTRTNKQIQSCNNCHNEKLYHGMRLK
jgi:hypothetical protein